MAPRVYSLVREHTNEAPAVRALDSVLARKVLRGSIIILFGGKTLRVAPSFSEQQRISGPLHTYYGALRFLALLLLVDTIRYGVVL